MFRCHAPLMTQTHRSLRRPRQQAQQQQQQQAAAKRQVKDTNLQDMHQFWKFFHLVPAQVCTPLGLGALICILQKAHI